MVLLPITTRSLLLFREIGVPDTIATAPGVRTLVPTRTPEPEERAKIEWDATVAIGDAPDNKRFKVLLPMTKSLLVPKDITVLDTVVVAPLARNLMPTRTSEPIAWTGIYLTVVNAAEVGCEIITVLLPI